MMHIELPKNDEDGTLTALFCAVGDPFDIDHFLIIADWDKYDPEIWHKGDAMCLGKVRPNSGIRIELVKTKDIDNLFNECLSFMNSEDAALGHLYGAQQVHMRIEVLVGVGGQVSYARYLTFPPDIMSRLAAQGIALQLFVYPSS